MWIGYALFAKYWGQHERSLIATTNRYRCLWMLQATVRDPRMLDGLITQNLSHTPSFFSSTTIIIIGGLLALMGTTDKAAELVREIPFATQTPMLVLNSNLGADGHFCVCVFPLFVVDAPIHLCGLGDWRHAARARI